MTHEQKLAQLQALDRQYEEDRERRNLLFRHVLHALRDAPGADFETYHLPLQELLQTEVDLTLNRQQRAALSERVRRQEKPIPTEAKRAKPRSFFGRFTLTPSYPKQTQHKPPLTK